MVKNLPPQNPNPAPLFRTDRSPIDGYTLAHFAFGYIAKQNGWSVSSILVVATLYELLEDQLIKELGILRRVGWTAEPKSNALMDVLAAYLGSQLS